MMCRNNILPALAQRYFRGTEGLDYQVAVTSGRNKGKPTLFIGRGLRQRGNRRRGRDDGYLWATARATDKDLRFRFSIRRRRKMGRRHRWRSRGFPLLRDVGADQDWRLIVRHRRGGALGAFIADSRRRDLAISFGVLLLLVISMAILIFTSTRAQRLAKLQMDFVTAVSHELRTPLTVISSAAENIAHGVVEGKPQLEQYGSVIGAQARKLFEMVEQILLFAAIREGQQRYSLRPLEVPEILDAALSGTAGLIRTAGFHVEQQIEPNLPRIVGDLPALSQCVQNLITNALKYGSEQKWIGIQARLTEHGLDRKRNSDQRLGSRHRNRSRGIAAYFRAVLSQPFRDGRANSWHRPGPASGEKHHGSDERPGHGEERSRARQHVHAAFALCGTLGAANGSQDDRGGFFLIDSPANAIACI